jgi:hypothetical protein
VLGLACHRTGVTPDASPVVDDEAEVSDSAHPVLG